MLLMCECKINVEACRTLALLRARASAIYFMMIALIITVIILACNYDKFIGGCIPDWHQAYNYYNRSLLPPLPPHLALWHDGVIIMM